MLNKEKRNYSVVGNQSPTIVKRKMLFKQPKKAQTPAKNGPQEPATKKDLP